MGFVRLNKILKEQRTIKLDTAFIFEYMPLAPDNYVKVYLTGLAFSSSEDNDIEGIALKLDLDTSTVLEAFKYWEHLELVELSDDHSYVEYQAIKPISKLSPKFDPKKYEAFNSWINNRIKNRTVTPNEFNEYYTIMETTGLTIEAMEIIIGHCIRNNIKDYNNESEPEVGKSTITKLARNLAHSGYRTYDAVKQKLEELELSNDDLKNVFKVLGLSRTPLYKDKALLISWKRDYKFEQSTIIHVAKTLPGKEMSLLDVVLFKFCKNGITSKKEIDAHNNKRNVLFSLAKEFMEIVGVYEPYAWAVDNFFEPWTKLGFSNKSLLVIANHAKALTKFQRQLKQINDAFIEPFTKKGAFDLSKVETELKVLSETNASSSTPTFIRKNNNKDDTVVVREGNRNFVSRSISAEELNKIFDEVSDDEL